MYMEIIQFFIVPQLVLTEEVPIMFGLIVMFFTRIFRDVSYGYPLVEMTGKPITNAFVLDGEKEHINEQIKAA